VGESVSGPACPACGAAAEELPDRPHGYRCTGCGREWISGGRAARRAQLITTKVRRVVRSAVPAAESHEELRVRASESERGSRAQPSVDAVPPEVVQQAADSPLLSELGVSLRERFAPLSVLDDGAADKLYLALDHLASRLVALRVGKSVGDGLARRCDHEARLLARVAHPNVVALVDHGVAGGVAWIAYQYLEGAPLRRHLDSGPLAPRSAAWIVAQVLDGLEALHGAGWVHRELSPDRVRESGTELFKLLGFARALPPPGQAPLDWRIGGDPRYLAPENVAGERPGSGADVYSAGAVLYELLTGAPPFLTSDANLLMVKHACDAPVPPSQRSPVPQGYDEIVLRALAKHPEERFASAREMADALRALVG
jgi:serine/threonine-protein kinase